jgi:nicotinamidase/pyrazinamidase
MGIFSKPCLVDIDTQIDFVRPEGALYVHGAQRLVPLWRELTAFGETNSLPMIASVVAHGEQDPESRPLPPHCVVGTPGQLKIPETLAMKYQFVPNERRDTTIDFETQVILEKQNLDVFTNVHAAEVFGMVQCSTFVLYGVTTEYSVRAAAFGLMAANHRVHVLSDAIKAIDDAAGERVLAELANAGAAFIQSAVFFDKVRQHLANRAL